MNLLKRSLVLVGLFAATLLVTPHPGTAQIHLDVRIGAPPPYRIAAPPQLVVIPGTYVYVVPDINADVFFWSGNWYRLYEGHWFSGRSYNGPWAYVPDPRVPRALFELPPDYRRIPPGWRRIPYGEFRRNWSGWERDRYWDRDRDWREGWHGRREERRDDRRDRYDGRPGEGRDRDFDRGDRGRDRN